MTETRSEILNYFLRDIKDHSMSVELDQGVFRSLKFSRDGSSCYYFRITTYPGHLVISGDMGCFVFARLPDMFNFFGEDKEELNINPHYWAEKVQAGIPTEFSKKEAERAILDYLESRLESREYSEEDQTELKEEIDTLIRRLGDCWDEGSVHSLINEFDYKGFEFVDFFEYNLRDYTYHYIWCCYAIVWGIQQYNKAKSHYTFKDDPDTGLYTGNREQNELENDLGPQFQDGQIWNG